jgi:hypothetical protein
LHNGCIGTRKVKLTPLRPPGPSSCKARGFAAEIRLLREQGHTFESIREALAAAGVRVSNSTVQREVARAARLLPNAPALARRPLLDESVPSPTEAPTEAPTVRPARPPDPFAPSDTRTGKEVAEAYFAAHPSNQLLRARKDRP